MKAIIMFSSMTDPEEGKYEHEGETQIILKAERISHSALVEGGLWRTLGGYKENMSRQKFQNRQSSRCESESVKEFRRDSTTARRQKFRSLFFLYIFFI